MSKETLEDDIDTGAMLAFHIGNDVQSEMAQCFRWCSVSGSTDEHNAASQQSQQPTRGLVCPDGS